MREDDDDDDNGIESFKDSESSFDPSKKSHKQDKKNYDKHSVYQGNKSPPADEKRSKKKSKSSWTDKFVRKHASTPSKKFPLQQSSSDSDSDEDSNTKK